MDSGEPVEAERQTRSRDSVGAVMCGVQASAALRAGAVGASKVVAVATAVGEASRVAAAGAGAAVVVAGVDEAGKFFCY